MKWFDKSKKGAVERQNQAVEKQTITTNPTMEELRAFFYNDDIANISSSMLNSATYYACMQIRCNAVAKLPIKLMQDTDQGAQTAKDHSLYQLLKNRPNPYTNAHDFLWATEFQRLEYGNAYWVMDTYRGKIRALYLLDSSKVTIKIDDIGILNNKKNAVYYLYTDAKNGEIIYQSEAIVHFKNFSLNGLEGTSIKKYLYDIIANEQLSNNVMRERYKTGLMDPIIVEYIGDLDDAKRKKIIDKFQKLGGAKNAGKVIPIPTEFKVAQLETKLVNNQFFELQGLTTRHIANGFGVKSFQLNDMEKSTYSNIEQQNEAFYSDTLQNVLTEYEQEMDYKMLFQSEKKAGYFTKFFVDVILRGDLLKRYQAHQIGISSGFLSIAEARKKEDLPYKEGTDNLIIGNGASIPLSDLGKQYPAKGGD